MGLPTGVEQKVAEPAKAEVVPPVAEAEVKTSVLPTEKEVSFNMTTNSEAAESTEVMIVGEVQWLDSIMSGNIELNKEA